MKIDILTLFPEAFDSFLAHSMMKRAIQKEAVSVRAHDLRQYAHDRHRTCDDRPFGGGPGMLMRPEPIFEAAEDLLGPPRGVKSRLRRQKARFIYLTPQGKRLDQKRTAALSRQERLILLCGHYEGVDQRVVDAWVTDEISIGDYVLTGGETAAMVLMDAVVRLLDGVLGCGDSAAFESFSENLLEYPQYTRPAVFKGLAVPKVLLSGNHEAIERWRARQALRRTLAVRPDLLKQDP